MTRSSNHAQRIVGVTSTAANNRRRQQRIQKAVVASRMAPHSALSAAWHIGIAWRAAGAAYSAASAAGIALAASTMKKITCMASRSSHRRHQRQSDRRDVAKRHAVTSAYRSSSISIVAACNKRKIMANIIIGSGMAPHGSASEGSK